MDHSLARTQKKMSLDRGSFGAMQEAFVTLVNYRFKRCAFELSPPKIESAISVGNVSGNC